MLGIHSTAHVKVERVFHGETRRGCAAYTRVNSFLYVGALRATRMRIRSRMHVYMCSQLTFGRGQLF